MTRFGGRLRTTYLLTVLGTVAVVLAFVGWLRQGIPLGDAVFKTLGVLSANGSYDEAAKWRPRNLWLETARWFGFAFFLLTAKKAFGLMLSNQLSDLGARWRAHAIVLIGDHPVFADLASVIATRRSLLWISGEEGTRRSWPRTVPCRWTPELIHRFRLARAQTVVIGYKLDDMQALAVAESFAHLSSASDVLLMSGELATHERLQAAPDLSSVRLVSPERAIARGLHHSHPPFRIARDLGHDRIHALFIGMGETAEQILRDLIQCSVTSFLSTPRVTIIDPRANEIFASLRVRVPELHELAEVEALLPAGHTDARALPVDALVGAHAAAPFTIGYVCLRDDAAALSCAFALERFGRQQGWSLGALFVRQRSSQTQPVDGRTNVLGTVIPFGTIAQLAEGLGLFGEGPDRIARALHEGYRASFPNAPTADVPWEALPEDLREANRAVLMHLPAKLASIDPIAGSPPDERTALQQVIKDRELLERLAELEHARWAAQRRLGGWRFAPQRDNQRRFHPDLVPYSALSEAAKENDRDMIRALAAALDHRPEVR